MLIWQWISCPENSSAVQAIGSIAQVLTALITLFFMVWLGITQNKISKQQNDLAMTPIIKKRNDIYSKIISTIILHRDTYPSFLIDDSISDDEKSHDLILYIIDMGDNIGELEMEKSELNSCFGKKFVEDAECLINEEIENLKIYQDAKIKFNNEKQNYHSSYEHNPNYMLRNECERKVNNSMKKIEALFKPELQFCYK